MGIDYNAVAGFGISITWEDLNPRYSPIEERADDWDPYDQIEVMIKGTNIIYSSYGDNYNGDDMGFLLEPENYPKNMEEMLLNGKEVYEKFLADLKKIGISKTMSDIRFVCEVSIS